VHWGTFNLALHPWNEPAERILIAAADSGVRVAIPRPGQPFEPADPVPQDPWWRQEVRSEWRKERPGSRT
jgi:hypothetical protein